MAISINSSLEWEDIENLYENLNTALDKFSLENIQIPGNPDIALTTVISNLKNTINASITNNKYFTNQVPQNEILVPNKNDIIKVIEFLSLDDTINKMNQACAYDGSEYHSSCYNYTPTYSSNGNNYTPTYSSNNNNYTPTYSSNNNNYTPTYSSNNNNYSCNTDQNDYTCGINYINSSCYNNPYNCNTDVNDFTCVPHGCSCYGSSNRVGYTPPSYSSNTNNYQAPSPSYANRHNASIN